ncbi:MAG: hypothetical protein WKF59_10400 [Chitinophagaceae bacterium]
MLIGFRLFNEVWSNTTVIGSLFWQHRVHSAFYHRRHWYLPALTLAYTLKGGMRTSLITDSIQMIFFGCFAFHSVDFYSAQKAMHHRPDYLSSRRTGQWRVA